MKKTTTIGKEYGIIYSTMEYDKFRRLHNQFEEVFVFIETVQAILQDI